MHWVEYVGVYSGVDSQPLALIQSDGAIRFKTLLWLASASGTINGIDGGTNSILTRKIPKNTVKFDFLVTCYGICLAIKRDHFFQ